MLIALILLLFITAACGPEESASDQGALAAQTQEIAQQYAADGDIARARAGLAALEVANANQWLLYLTEKQITDGADLAATRALARLVNDLGLQSSVVAGYAAANGLAAAGPAVEAVAAQPAVADAQQAPTATATQAAAQQPAAEPVVALPAPTATSGPEAAAATSAPPPAATEDPSPMATADTAINVRGGPGTAYAIVGALQPSQAAAIVAKSPAGDWWQVSLADGQQGWVFGELVAESGDLSQVAVAANIPEPPPTATPAPVAAEAPAAAEPPPAAPTAAQPASPPSDQPHFTLVQKRLWSKEENDGCVGKHLLRIHVIDANGVRLNGVRLKGIYTGEILVTGAQGKGDGVIEYDLYKDGEGFTIVQDLDGREATSDRAEGFTTISPNIDKQTLIGAGYCSDSADCDKFYYSYGCSGHHSWEATFQRNY